VEVTIIGTQGRKVARNRSMRGIKEPRVRDILFKNIIFDRFRDKI
jgi:hypothetical protein